MNKVVVFGSTNDEIHIGCKALISGLENLIQKKFKGEASIQHISHRFLSPFFHKGLMKNNSKKVFFGKYYSDNSFSVSNDYEDWLFAYKSMYENDMFLKLTISNADLIVVNVEGTIHHQSLLGMQMFAIGKMASELGKEVFWVNFSIEKENELIVKDALNNATKIAAREKFSYEYLNSMDIDVIQAFDTAVLASYDETESLGNNFKYKNSCLFTGSNIKKVDVLDTAMIIKDHGLNPVYLPLGLNDYDEYRKIKKNKIDSFDYSELSYFDIINTIKNFEVVVSGRHHLNVFSFLARKPFIAFESNTWKIEGVCEMFNYPVDFKKN